MEYPKINSLWKREDIERPRIIGKKHALIPGQYALPEFGNIKRWHVQEKIDGTNIRIIYKQSEDRLESRIDIAGRTDDASIPKKLAQYLENHFTKDRLSLFIEPNFIGTMILYGEGYGQGIQKAGHYYQEEQEFILFDVNCNGWWLERHIVKKIADKLDIPYAPDIGIMTEDEIVAYVKSKPPSLCSYKSLVMEGVICRPEFPLFLRNGKPLMFKLKVKDFEG